MAKKQGVSGWHSMRKEQLVQALLKLARNKRNRSRRSSSKTSASKATARKKSCQVPTTQRAKRSVAGANASNGKTSNGRNGTASKSQKKATAKKTRVTSRIRRANEERQQLKDLSISGAGQYAKNGSRTAKRNGRKRANTRDRVVVMVRDPYWLHVCWEIRRQSIDRVRAAMSEQWHTARPALRLLEVGGGGTTNTAERVVREVEIHGGVNNWYLHVSDPPKSFRVDIGYVADNGRFYSLSRSNSVTTPRPGSSDTLDHNWSDIARDYEKVYGMSGGYEDGANSGDLKELFEERLGRPMGSSLSARYGISADAGGRHSQFVFNADAELIIYGQAKSDAHVTLAGQPLKLRPDGSFTVRRSLPDRRQVLPLVASSRDGLEQRTVILAIERNTKVMEPITREGVS